MQVSTFASNVERSVTIRVDSFWIALLIIDKVLDNVLVSVLACKVQESETRRILHLIRIHSLLSDEIFQSE